MDTISIFQSPFQSLVDSNYSYYIPTENEVHQIKEFLTSLKLKLANIDEEIASLHNKLRGMIQQRDALAHAVKTHQALISPIRWVPDDVLEEIFMACLPGDFVVTLSVYSLQRKAPFLLTHVCHRWRDLALSMPRLWAQVYVDLESVVSLSRRQREIRDQIDRSRDCPLEIYFRWSNLGEWHPQPDSDTVDLLIEPILSVLHRWRKVSLDGVERITVLLERMVPSELSLLEELVLRVGDIRWRHDSSHPAEFLRAPNLRKLCIRGHLTLSTCSVALWRRLTHFTISTPSSAAQKLAGVLALCHNLVNCFILVTGRVYHHITPAITTVYPKIRLPNLIKLTFNEEEPSEIHNYWDLPGLRDLEIRTNGETTCIPSLRAIVERTNGSIQKLTTQMDLDYQAGLLVCFVQCPSLTTLVLEAPSRINFSEVYSDSDFNHADLDGVHYDNLMKGLMPGQGPHNTTRCPKLETLRCHRVRMVFSNEALVKFITARQCSTDPEISKLKSVLVSFGNVWDEGGVRQQVLLNSLSSFMLNGFVVDTS